MEPRGSWSKSGSDYSRRDWTQGFPLIFKQPWEGGGCSRFPAWEADSERLGDFPEVSQWVVERLQTGVQAGLADVLCVPLSLCQRQGFCWNGLRELWGTNPFPGADWSLSFALDTASFSPYTIFLALRPQPQAKGEPAERSSGCTPSRANRKRTLIYHPKRGRAMPGKKQVGGVGGWWGETCRG